MDPDAALKGIRRSLKAYYGYEANGDEENMAQVASDLVDQIEGLDEWLSKGGPLPEDWKGER